MPEATSDDLYNTLEHHPRYKVGSEILEELEKGGKKAGHLRGTMYVYLSKWEEEGIVKSRERPLSKKEMEMGLSLPRKEYCKNPTCLVGKGIAEGLEALAPA